MSKNQEVVKCHLERGREIDKIRFHNSEFHKHISFFLYASAHL